MTERENSYGEGDSSLNANISYGANINDDANISGLNPIPGLNAHNITAVIKRNGSITGYMLSNGEILNKDEAINRAKSGGINNIAVAMRKGNEYLRSLPDDSEANNLSSMPFFDD